LKHSDDEDEDVMRGREGVICLEKPDLQIGTVGMVGMVGVERNDTKADSSIQR